MNSEDEFAVRLAKKVPTAELRLKLLLNFLGMSGVILDFLHDSVPMKKWPLPIKYAAAILASNIRACICDDQEIGENDMSEPSSYELEGSDGGYKMSEQTQERIMRKLRKVLEEMNKIFEEEDKV